MKEDQLQWFTSFLTKQFKVSGIKSMSNQQLENELQTPIIIKF